MCQALAWPPEAGCVHKTQALAWRGLADRQIHGSDPGLAELRCAAWRPWTSLGTGLSEKGAQRQKAERALKTRNSVRPANGRGLYTIGTACAKPQRHAAAWFLVRGCRDHGGGGARSRGRPLATGGGGLLGASLREGRKEGPRWGAESWPGRVC